MKGRERLERFLEPCRGFSSRHLLVTFGLVVAAALLLAAMGRAWWCEAGDLSPWSSDTVSQHNSQHLFDPYTFTHVLHGIGLYALLWLLCRRWVSREWRGVMAIGIESAWEVLENTSMVIEQYRNETLALGYFGDSVANSLGDILACALGYLIAMTVPVWVSLFLFLGTELVLLWWIRDGLILNILMLLWPLEGVRDWQSGPR